MNPSIKIHHILCRQSEAVFFAVDPAALVSSTHDAGALCLPGILNVSLFLAVPSLSHPTKATFGSEQPSGGHRLPTLKMGSRLEGP